MTIKKMEKQYVKVLSVRHITHDVLQIETEKPPLLSFIPGQAAELSINKANWSDVKRPFTFTCIPKDDYLQFTIKTYPLRNGVTGELLNLKINDELILHDVFGTIRYVNEGYFIAGGAGVTPFISILRDLSSKNALGNNKLIFANKTREDIILRDEFEKMLGKNFINILSDEVTDGYFHGLITKSFLESTISDLTKNIYVCGPDKMLLSVGKMLSELKVADKLIVTEAA